MPVAAPRKGTLIVRLLGRTVGRLDYSSHHNEMRFSYEPEYLADSASMPLSRSLPLRSEPFDTETTTVFFENLLPPDQVRRKLGPILHISRHNIFGFLEALEGIAPEPFRCGLKTRRRRKNPPRDWRYLMKMRPAWF